MPKAKFLFKVIDYQSKTNPLLNYESIGIEKLKQVTCILRYIKT